MVTHGKKKNEIDIMIACQPLLFFDTRREKGRKRDLIFTATFFFGSPKTNYAKLIYRNTLHANLCFTWNSFEKKSFIQFFWYITFLYVNQIGIWSSDTNRNQ